MVAKRSAAFPDLPTIGEFYPGYEVTIWLGLFAPAGTPAPIVTRINDTVSKILLDPAINLKETLFHGQPVADARVNAMLTPERLADPILYPPADLLNNLEFGAAQTLTNPDRAELMARFKSA